MRLLLVGSQGSCLAPSSATALQHIVGAWYIPHLYVRTYYVKLVRNSNIILKHPLFLIVIILRNQPIMPIDQPWFSLTAVSVSAGLGRFAKYM